MYACFFHRMFALGFIAFSGFRPSFGCLCYRSNGYHEIVKHIQLNNTKSYLYFFCNIYPKSLSLENTSHSGGFWNIIIFHDTPNEIFFLPIIIGLGCLYQSFLLSNFLDIHISGNSYIRQKQNLICFFLTTLHENFYISLMKTSPGALEIIYIYH